MRRVYLLLPAGRQQPMQAKNTKRTDCIGATEDIKSGSSSLLKSSYNLIPRRILKRPYNVLKD
jgi:hypothetical protein